MKRFVTLLLFFTIIGLIVFSSSCISKKSTDIKSINLKTMEENISENKSKIDYKKYIKAEIKKVAILKNTDNNLCDINQQTRISNISKNNIKIKFIWGLPNAMINVFHTDTWFLNNYEFELKPKQGVTSDWCTNIKNYKLMTPVERKILNNNAYTLYLQVLINNKIAYLKVTENNKKIQFMY